MTSVRTTVKRPTTEELLDHCLYFTTARLGRILNKWAEQAFADQNLAPSQAYALMAVNEKPGQSQQELAQLLHLAPSTLTRFLDKLEARGLVRRREEGRLTYVDATEEGLVLEPVLEAGWAEVWKRYSAVLGDEGDTLATTLTRVARSLEG